jgi:murein DD-endopeptidase MepM/ murein hydrolase activator NlpD
MKTRLSYFTREFTALKQSITSLKETNNELSRLVELKSKNDILKSAQFSDSGSINIEAIKKEMMETIESVAEIKKYITEQKNIYLATPRGWPMEGQISSGFGSRHHPVTGVRQHHSGLDIRAPRGHPSRSPRTASSPTRAGREANGNIIVVEHGHGFSTAYAHNKENLVTVGQKVRKGQDIALTGSTACRRVLISLRGVEERQACRSRSLSQGRITMANKKHERGPWRPSIGQDSIIRGEIISRAS